jgi:hypothetical protein
MRVCALMCALVIGGAAWADTVVVSPSKDNTLIEDVRGGLSNGQGDGVFSGRTGVFGGQSRKLRAVLAFDVASAVPAGSTITGASLTMLTVNSVSGAIEHTLHRVTADWGEGASSGAGGSGAPAQAGDATWLHRFYPDVLWSAAGGEFAATPSASAEVASFGLYVTWSSAAMAADVQQWLDGAAGNFGWMVIGDEAAFNTAKKFAGKEWETVEERPMLVIEFTPPPCVGDATDDGQVNIDDVMLVLNAWGNSGKPGANPADVNDDGDVDMDDLWQVLMDWGPCG